VKEIFSKPECLTDNPLQYCPGCSHGIAHRLVGEVMDELEIMGKSIIVTTIGCSVRCWRNFNIDAVQGPHGRGMAVATGLKRSLPDRVIFSYQGDGDLAAIGMGETIHASNRGEGITVIFVNNSVFGATGGQLAPTSLVNQKTSTYPDGRDPDIVGPPIHVAELLASLPYTSYIAREALTNPRRVLRAKRYIKKAFEVQMHKNEFALVELLGACPPNLKKEPKEALKWVEEEMVGFYPVGELKTEKTAEKETARS